MEVTRAQAATHAPVTWSSVSPATTEPASHDPTKRPKAVPGEVVFYWVFLPLELCVACARLVRLAPLILLVCPSYVLRPHINFETREEEAAAARRSRWLGFPRSDRGVETRAPPGGRWLDAVDAGKSQSPVIPL
ncbi:hypothetical protein GUJ93_ZPchr0006g43147 [Zizania palustris]|uniref:Uncharacterized protein n=1 Tax=Zizania palustris TaxID=103762 RepID=A0A8J5T878_ZIZPA|nr:hypothetical protein GUJ93_ZPchr0006g43147 [Zizania palustris]